MHLENRLQSQILSKTFSTIFKKNYMSVLVFSMGLNIVRFGDVGGGAVISSLICTIVWGAFILRFLASYTIKLSWPDFFGVAIQIGCAFWAVLYGDARLASSLVLSLTSYLVLRNDILRKNFLFKYVFFYPLLVSLVFYIFFIAFPALVFQPEEGGKYINLAGFDVLRFEGATLNANSYGLAMALLIFCLLVQKIPFRRMYIGAGTLLLSFSYSGMISLIYLVGFQFFRSWGRFISIALIVSILPTYALVKGWGIFEGVRVVKYSYYFINLLDQPLSLLALGGIPRSGHDWVILSDNLFLTLTYDFGFLYLFFYLLGFIIFLRQSSLMIAVFLFIAFVVDLQYFWLANLMLMLAAHLIRKNNAVQI